MSEIIKRPFRSFNGTDWDKHYFETSADQVKYTESDGSETELQAKIEKINDNLEFLNYGYAMYPDKSIHHATWQDVSESIKQKNPGNNIFFDTGSYHISVDREGTYLVIAQALFDANNSGVRGCRILVNDGNSTESPEFTWIPNSAMPFPVDVTRVITLSKNDRVRMILYQGSGSDLGVKYVSLRLYRLGAKMTI